MDKRRLRLIELALTVTAALVVIVALLAMNNLQPSSPNTVPPGKGPGGNNTTVIPPPTVNPPPPSTNPPPGGGGTGAGNNTTNLPPSGKIPPGWAHAHCPSNLDERLAAHGVKARCMFSMTFGAMKKAGLVNFPSQHGASMGLSRGQGHAYGNSDLATMPGDQGVRAHGDPATKQNQKF